MLLFLETRERCQKLRETKEEDAKKWRATQSAFSQGEQGEEGLINCQRAN